ncbi:hypothetical protein ABID99_001285 [Mucilaginibacter sp. OAE612]|uniref:hypothetical protein n=1 Tax=Mucilaginibacter sp. OAE612 TaxID=3156444 RepID=UPI00359DE909
MAVFDLRLIKRVTLLKKQYFEISVDLFNVANLLNKEWGVNHNLGATPIYTIKSFDPVKKQYAYAVNTNAGVSNLSGNPYQFQIGLRYGF